jgi:hypothetical protein
MAALSCGGRCHNVSRPPSENLEEGGVGADGDAEAREGGQDDGDHGLHPHLLGILVHTAEQDDQIMRGQQTVMMDQAS